MHVPRTSLIQTPRVILPSNLVKTKKCAKLQRADPWSPPACMAYDRDQLRGPGGRSGVVAAGVDSSEGSCGEAMCSFRPAVLLQQHQAPLQGKG